MGKPAGSGYEDQYKVESVADRRSIRHQLQDYVHRDYLNDVSVAQDVHFNTILPVQKPNGTF